MGCWLSSPYQRRIYRDPGDLDEVEVPTRYFGTLRAASNLLPDDIAGMESTHIYKHLATDPDLLLYEAEIDHGYGFRCFRLAYLLLLTPIGWVYLLSKGLSRLCVHCTCDEAFCWVRKEYSTRKFFRVYPNRIEINLPKVRFPFGYFGCGSWNADSIMTHPFDRGAFGFSTVSCGTINSLCCTWPVYGGTVVRHRCQCYGPLWNRMLTDCGGWWCEEWICKLMCCVYAYDGIAEPEETAFACSIALQAFFEGRTLTKEDMDKCIAFWKENISELEDPIGRKRPVCCEPIYVPCCDAVGCYKAVHPKRTVPYAGDGVTDKLVEAYDKYAAERKKQVRRYKNARGPLRNSTLCRTMGCRRVFGRKGFCFCTEGCNHCDRKAGEPAPPMEVVDLDDYFDASTVLIKVLGPPPSHVVIKRWRYDPERGEQVLEVYPEEKNTEE